MNFSIIIIVAACSALLCIVFYYSKMRHLQSVERKTRDKWQNIAYDLLEIAVTQRSIFSVESSLPEAYGNNPRGPCTRITDKNIFVTVGDSASTLNLVGEKVKVFFNITNKRKPAFYQFTTQVLDVKSYGSSQTLCLSMPARLETGQKRNFVRVTPQKTAVQALAMWSLQSDDPLQSHLPLPAYYGDLPGATFHYRPEKIHELFLENISAGGMRITITSTLDKYATINLRKGSRLLLLIVLRSDEDESLLPFWLECKIRIVDDAPDQNGVLTTGLSFTRWAIMELGKTVPISWFPVDSSGGVSPLASWVMRHHLEQHKIL